MAAPMAYGSSWAGIWIQDAAVTYAAAAAMPGPLTHCARPGIVPVPPQWYEPLLTSVDSFFIY